RRPSTSPATVALARPAPIDWATWVTETGVSNWRWLPSGRVMVIMAWSGFAVGFGDSQARDPWEIRSRSSPNLMPRIQPAGWRPTKQRHQAPAGAAGLEGNQQWAM